MKDYLYLLENGKYDYSVYALNQLSTLDGKNR